MTGRRKLLLVLAVLGLQFAAVVVFIAVETDRGESTTLGTAPPRRVSGDVAVFDVTTRGGHTRNLVGGDRPVLVHFWGTWCPPCLDELPLVLGLPADGAFDVVAVALDDNWSQVDAFLDGRDSSRVVLADRSFAEAKFDISSLPQTVLMAADGKLLLRANGARDWSDQGFLDSWSSERVR